MSHLHSLNTTIKVVLVMLVAAAVFFPLPEAAGAEDPRHPSLSLPTDLRDLGGPGGSQEALVKHPRRSVGELLRGDGTADLNTAFSRALDKDGYRLVSGTGEAPQFDRLSAAGDERWSDQFAPQGVSDKVKATAGNAQATILFTPPASDGGSLITSYTVTSSPGDITANRAKSPITVKGLTNGTAYTFTVKAMNAIGAGQASIPSNSVTPGQ